MSKTTPLPTEVRRRVQKALRTRSFRAALRSNSGAIDLASIMVGVIVIGVIAGIIAATVFAVIPWSQNSAAKQSLDSVRTAEGVAFVMTDKYQTVDQLIALGYLQAPSGSTVAEGFAGGSGTGIRGPVLAVTAPQSTQVVLNAAGTCYVSGTRSATGDIYFSTNKSAGADRYVAGTSNTDWCAPLEPLVIALGGSTSVGGAAAPAAPTNVVAVLTGSSVALTWASLSAATSFTVTQYRDGIPEPSVVISGTPPAKTATFVGLSSSKTYSYKVSAQTVAGSSVDSVMSAGVTTSILLNGGFEYGLASWTVTGMSTLSTGRASARALYLPWDSGRQIVSMAYQDFMIPAAGTTTLSGYVAMTGDGRYDSLSMKVLRADGTTLVFFYNNLIKTQDWTAFSVNLTPYAGQSARLLISKGSANSSANSSSIDDVVVTTVP